MRCELNSFGFGLDRLCQKQHMFRCNQNNAGLVSMTATTSLGPDFCINAVHLVGDLEADPQGCTDEQAL